MAGRFRGERVLAVIGAAVVLVMASDALTFAATGSSLILGRINQANATTTIQNTGTGSAIKLVTKSTASAPMVVNGKGKVTNLYADRAAKADVAVKAATATKASFATKATSATSAATATNAGKLGGKTLAQVQADALSAAKSAMPRPNVQQAAMGQTWGSVVPGFTDPTQSVTDGTHLFVVNSQRLDVTEINLSADSYVQSFVADSTGAAYPVAIANDGTNLWIARSDSKVSVMNIATGALVTTLQNSTSAPVVDLKEPSALMFDGGYMWVANHFDATVSKFNISTFEQVYNVAISPSPIQMVSDGVTLYVVSAGGNVDRVPLASGPPAPSWPVVSAKSAVFDGRRLWVGGSSDITIFDLDTDVPSSLPSNPSVTLSSVTGLAYDGQHVWAVSDLNNEVYEFDAGSGALVRKFSGGRFGFHGPDTVTVAGGHVWITNYSGGSVTRLNLP